MAESPFPGMGPFLETDWLAVHSALVTYIRDQLQERLPAALCARMESRVLVEDDSKYDVREQHPDVRVVEAPRRGSGGGVAVLEPPQMATAEPDIYLTEARGEPATQRFVQIIDSQTHGQVVTTIELISPTNKRRGIGQKLYRAKRAECIEAGVNLVKIDLTRGGDRSSIMPTLDEIQPQPTYLACVRRPAIDHLIAVYLLPLDRPLKPIRIPLRPKDEDVVLDLQPLVQQAYARGRYDRLDYSRPLDPPPNKEEAAIIARFLQQAGKIGAP